MLSSSNQTTTSTSSTRADIRLSISTPFFLPQSFSSSSSRASIEGKSADQLSPELATLSINVVCEHKEIQSRNMPELSRSRFGIVRNLARKVFDTQTLFAFGDWAQAVITAQYLGISANAIAGYIAVRSRHNELVKGEKPSGDGFYAMGWVSALTTASIIINSIAKYGTDFLALSQSGQRELFFSMTAFGAWTIANFLGGLNRKNQRENGANLASNHQVWFCLGSIFATQASPIALALLSAGLIQSLRRNRHHGETLNLRQFLDKHLSPSRFRCIAYASSAYATLSSNPLYFIPYSLWMLGNLAFDNGGANSSLKKDLKKLLHKQA